METDGCTEPDQTRAPCLYDELIEAGVHDKAYEHVREVCATSPGYHVLRDYLGPFDAQTWTFWKRERDHDPIPDCLALRCPHLALFGAADQMVPVEASVTAFTTAACDSARHPASHTTNYIVPGTSHRLLREDCVTPDRSVLEQMSTWISRAPDAADS